MYGAACQNANLERAFGAHKKTVLYTVKLVDLQSTASEQWPNLVGKPRLQLVIKHEALNAEDTSNSSTISRQHCCTSWDHRWWKLNSVTWEISFCFMCFHLTANIPWINYAYKLRDCCICIQAHIWTVLPLTGIGQLLSHSRATHPLLICNLEYTTGGCDVGTTWNKQQLAIFLCATALMLVQLAPDKVNGWQNTQPTSTLLAWHKIKATNTTVTPRTAQAPFHPTILQVQQLPAWTIVLFHSEYLFFGIFNNACLHQQDTYN